MWKAGKNDFFFKYTSEKEEIWIAARVFPLIVNK